MLSHKVVLTTVLAAAGVAAETVHGVVVYTRHGDRSTKHYGAQQLTNLGAQQNFQVGSDYRGRYLSSSSPHRILGISPDKYDQTQIYASAPDQSILLNTATAFLQGLYPPLVPINSAIAATTLNNGSTSTSPLNGYQYVVLHGENADSPDSIWIKGDDGCPNNAAAAKSFFSSTEFKSRLESTRDFYSRFYDVLAPGVYDYTRDQMTYANAYDIFDLINAARIHNASSPALQISDADMLQLRTLADSAEFGYNFNASQPARSIHAQTLIAGILRQLNQTVTSTAKLKFSLLAGSYDTMQAFFGLANLTSVSGDFYGLPDYASTLAIELFTPGNASAFPSNTDSDLRVRFLFRNGTYGTLTSWPLFGRAEDSLPWPEFVAEMKARAVDSAPKWCNACNSTLLFCAAYRESAASSSPAAAGSSGAGGLSDAVAGVIGAVAALAVAAVVGGIAFVVFRKKSQAATVLARAEKASLRSISPGSA